VTGKPDSCYRVLSSGRSPTTVYHGRSAKKSRIRVARCVFALVFAAGCASTQVTARQSNIGNEKLARPDRIIVHDFAATPADIPAWSIARDRYAAVGTSGSAQEIEVGRKLGAQVARDLVAEIQGMGMPAVHAASQPPPRVNDIVITGYFESVDKGSLTKRLVLGFGAGSADLKTVVEGYQMTDRGLRQLGSGEVGSGGGKSPGLLVPLAVTAATANPIGIIVGGAVKVGGEVTGRTTIEGTAQRTAKEIASQLEQRFEQQGWID